MSDDTRPLPPEYVGLAAHLVQNMTALLAEGEELVPVALTIKDGDIVAPVMGQFDSLDAKDGFAELVRQAASRHDADAIALISETWTLSLDGTQEEMTAKRQADKYPSLEDHPDRIDAAMCQLETREGTWSGLGHVVPRPGQRGRDLVNFTWRRMGQGKGRFSRFLPVQYASPDQLAVLLALARKRLLAAGLDPDYPMQELGTTLIAFVAGKLRQAPAHLASDATISHLCDLLIEGARQFGVIPKKD